MANGNFEKRSRVIHTSSMLNLNSKLALQVLLSHPCHIPHGAKFSRSKIFADLTLTEKLMSLKISTCVLMCTQAWWTLKSYLCWLVVLQNSLSVIVPSRQHKLDFYSRWPVLRNLRGWRLMFPELEGRVHEPRLHSTSFRLSISCNVGFC